MLSCEHDNWSNFDLILTSLGYVVRTVKISVEFVDGLSSSKGVEIVGGGNFHFQIIPLQLKIERNFKLGGLAPYHNKQLLYLNFFDIFNCLEVMG